MKLTVDAKKFKLMVQAAKKIVRKTIIYDHDQMNYIRCVITNNLLTMYACDGHKIMKDKIAVYSDCDFCFYMRPEMPPLHGKDPLTIEIVEGYVHATIDDIVYKTPQPTISKPYGLDQYFGTDDEVSFMIAVDSQKLIDALTNIKDQYNRNGTILKFTDHRNPIVIVGKDCERAVLPMVTGDVDNFYKMKKSTEQKETDQKKSEEPIIVKSKNKKPNKKVEDLLAKVEKLNNNTPNGKIVDADTILVDVLEASDFQVAGFAQAIFDIWKKSENQEEVEQMFYMFTDISFTNYLELCKEKITKKKV